MKNVINYIKSLIYNVFFNMKIQQKCVGSTIIGIYLLVWFSRLNVL